MSGFKLTIASSVYTKPYKWIRTIATTSAASKSDRGKLSAAGALNSNSERLSSVTSTYGWRITTCAPLSLMAYDSKNLGFRGHKRFSLSTSSSCSSEGKGIRNSTGLVSDMGAENKEGDWYENDHHPSSSNSSPLMQNQQQSSKLLTLPTILTLARVAAVPVFVCTFYMDSWWGTTATTSIFIAAAITDWLDGYIARKMRLGSAFGAFLDPVADKLMVAATLILLCTKPLEVSMFGQVPWLLTAPAIAIIGREITMSAVREWAASQNSKLVEAVAVNNLGKWKTATQMTALTILLATRDSSLGGGMLATSGIFLLYISAGLAVWSLAVYMRKIWKVLLK